jgi:hypothetical protein
MEIYGFPKGFSEVAKEPGDKEIAEGLEYGRRLRNKKTHAGWVFLFLNALRGGLKPAVSKLMYTTIHLSAINLKQPKTMEVRGQK